VIEFRNILLCVAGLTPQIITETLYALTQQRGERVDEIRVITTLPGQEKLLKSLLDPQHGRFFAFCRDYRIDPATIRFDHTSITAVQTSDGRTLGDIRLRVENERTADRICEIVRELAKLDDARIHASAAGGRKTMGIFLASAMQLFGRRHDALSHVLVNEPFENHPDFYYIPPEPQTLDLKDRQGQIIGRFSTADARIELADIPFVRLRGLLRDWLNDLPGSYGEIVQKTQIELDLQDAAQELQLDCKRKSVSLMNRRAVLYEREFFIYFFFARARKLGLGEDGFVNPGEITYDELAATFREFSRACGVEREIEDYDLVFKPKSLQSIIRDVKQSDRQSLQDTLDIVFSRIKSKLTKAGLPERCLIVPSGRYGAKRYGLLVASDRICWL
jgi:CRISPR-associated protein (TIGR02584 family)